MTRIAHDDQPTSQDLLDHAAIAARIEQRVRTCPTPYVLGIHGDWGTGKSSVLRMVEDKLGAPARKGEGRVVVRFEAWKHQFEEQPVVALLQAVRRAFTLERKFFDEVKKLVNVATYGALSVIDDLVKAVSLGTVPKGLAGTAREEGERYEAEAFAVPLRSEQIQELYAAAIEALLGENDRLVVLVDDLDRCADAAVVRLLESLKLYLNAKRCVYVIAADREAVVRAVQRGLFGGDPDKDDPASRRTRERAEAYVEKLFQSVEALPVTPPVAAFVGKLCETWPDKGAALLTVLGPKAGALPPNPRRIKRFVTELGSRVDAWESRHQAPPSPLEWPYVVIVQCLATFHPSLYRRLEADPEFFEKLVGFAKNGLTTPDETSLHLYKRPGRYDDPMSATRTWRPEFHDPGALDVLRVARLLQILPDVDVTAQAAVPKALLQ